MYPRPIKVASYKNIYKVWQTSRDAYGKGGAPGIDNMTAALFRERIESNISALSKQLTTAPYQFKPLKASLIPKGDGKFRVICIPTVQDRLIQRLVLKRLTYGQPPFFNPVAGS